MKKQFAAGVLGLGLVLSAFSQGASMENRPLKMPLIPPSAVEGMESAPRVLITSIGWMAITPRFVDAKVWQQSSRPVSANDAQVLMQHLKTSVRLEQEPTLARCHFAPGFQITFFDDQARVLESLLICLNCDVVAMGDRANLLYYQRSAAAAAKYPVIYGEAHAFRPQLIAMLTKYFPDEMKKWAELAVPGVKSH